MTMKFKQKTIDEIANMICGNYGDFIYRSSSLLTRFFKDCDTDYVHDGTTRAKWVAEVLEKILKEPNPNAHMPPNIFVRVIKALMDHEDAINEDSDRSKALAILNKSLSREGFEAFYGDNKECYLKHIATNTIADTVHNLHRPLSPEESKRKEQLANYLSKASEDGIIEKVLLPLFRALRFQRVTVVGHKDKALEYGIDMWMKYILPTSHVLYFGIQVKRGKLDTSARTKQGNANIAGILNQVQMAFKHPIFDPETSKKGLIDRIFIISGGEITKAARNWLSDALDATKRSQIMFMDRDDILNLYVTQGLPLPAGADSRRHTDAEIPF